MTDKNADNRSQMLLAPLAEKHPKMTVFVDAVFHYKQQLAYNNKKWKVVMI